MKTRCDCLIVGAGPAGLGVAIALQQQGVEDVLTVDRHGMGASFDRWPEQTRFITPSFPAHEFGCPDLNAVTATFSPGEWLGCEHPTGVEYARYLRELANRHRLTVHAGVDVQSVAKANGVLAAQTSAGTILSSTVVWAAGEFQYPAIHPFPGGDLCVHSMTLKTYRELTGSEYVVIGGYESGCDVASHLIAHCATVRILDPAAPWEKESGDPSAVLSIKTRARLRAMQKTGRLSLEKSAPVTGVERCDRGYRTHTADGAEWRSPTPPILATGFRGSLSLLPDAFARDTNGHVLLSEQDESTRLPGLFLAGPHVRHAEQLYCFIYKFRARFPLIAQAIAARLQSESPPLVTP